MILGPRTADTLNAYADTLIPGGDGWPAPSQAGVVAHAETAVTKNAALRGSLLFALQAVDVHAGRSRQVPFAELGSGDKVEALTELESQNPAVFGAVRELIYDAYYSSAPVRAAVEERTGFRARAALDGTGVAHFDDVLFRLADVAARPKRVREVR